MTLPESHRCGLVAIVGRPNVGKSTLLNRLIGQKISITSSKPQTTRHRIMGVMTLAGAQIGFIDTPGMQDRQAATPIARLMNRSVLSALQAADLIVMVSAARSWTTADAQLANALPKERPALLAINKVDRLDHLEQLLPLVDRLRAESRFCDFVPISAQSGKGVDALIRSCVTKLPVAPPLFAPDTLTDRDERFLAAEIIREKLFRLVGDEVPYGATVVIDRFIEQPKLRSIDATIIVERIGHQPIIVGPKGERIKRIGTEARTELERLFGSKVYLQLWVKPKRGWADSERSLRAYGYGQ